VQHLSMCLLYFCVLPFLFSMCVSMRTYGGAPFSRYIRDIILRCLLADPKYFRNKKIKFHFFMFSFSKETRRKKLFIKLFSGVFINSEPIWNDPSLFSLHERRRKSSSKKFTLRYDIVQYGEERESF